MNYLHGSVTGVNYQHILRVKERLMQILSSVKEGMILTTLLALYLASYFFLPMFSEGRNFAYGFLPAWAFSIAATFVALLRAQVIVSRYLLVYFLFMLLCLFSIVWSLEPATTFNHASRVGASTLVLPGIWFYCNSMPRIERFLKLYILAALIAVLMGFSFSWSSVNREFLEQSSSAVALLFGVAVAMVFIKWLFSNKVRWLLLIPILLMPLIAVGSLRGVGWSLGILLVYVVLRAMRDVIRLRAASLAKLMAIGIALIAGVVMLIMYVPTNLTERVDRNITTSQETLDGQDKEEAAAAGARIVFVIEGIAYLIKNPSWFGEGLASSYAIYQKEIGIRAYSHTTYIDLLMGVGWVGAIIYYSIFVHLLFRLATKSQNNSRIRDGLISVICGLFVLTLFGRFYESSAFMMLFMVVVAAYRIESQGTFKGLNNSVKVPA